MIEFDRSRTKTETVQERVRLQTCAMHPNGTYIQTGQDATLADLAEALKQMPAEHRYEILLDVWGTFARTETEKQRDALQARVKELDAGAAVQANTIRNMRMASERRDGEVEALRNDLSNQAKQLEAKTGEILGLKTERDALRRALGSRTQELGDQKAEIDRLRAERIPADPAPAWLAKWPKWALKALEEMADRRCLREWEKGSGDWVSSSFAAMSETVKAVDTVRPLGNRIYAAETAIMQLFRALAQAGEG